MPIGLVIGATPEGRKSGGLLVDVTSPFRSTDTHGPTPVIKPVSKIYNYLLSGGTTLNVKFWPQLLADERGIRRLVVPVRTSFDLGGTGV